MSKVQELTNDALLKRAGYAGRNLFALAILATLIEFCFCIGLVFSSDAHDLVWITVFFTLITIGYWMLAVAAKRGNPMSVMVVIAIAFVQLLLSIASYILAALRSAPNGFNLFGIIVVLSIIMVLVNSRNVLIEMKKRGIWEEKFSPIQQSGTLCKRGGVAFIIGYVGFMVSLLIPAIGAVKQAKASAEERQQAELIVVSITTQEADFIKSLKEIGSGDVQESAKVALIKLDSLENTASSFQPKVLANGVLSQFLTNYKEAIHKWKDGVNILANPSPDLEKATEMLKAGDRIRNEATKQFDKKINSK